jgi:hypothetical protein
VVFEGTATAAKDVDWSAPPPCLIALHARIAETTTYQRGTGVVVEFVRIGRGSSAPIVIQRPGRRFDASLAVVTTTTRTSEGSASRESVGVPSPVCGPLTEDLSKGADCGKPQVETAKARLLYQRGLLSLEMRGLTALAVTDCPESAIGGDLGVMAFSWPTPARLPQFILPRAAIFGKQKVIVRHVDSGRVKKGPVTQLAGTLSMTHSDFGGNRATIRLIRVR